LACTEYQGFEGANAWLFRGSDLKNVEGFGAFVRWRWRAGAGDNVA
jgi:hypothetical protein